MRPVSTCIFIVVSIYKTFILGRSRPIEAPWGGGDCQAAARIASEIKPGGAPFAEALGPASEGNGAPLATVEKSYHET